MATQRELTHSLSESQKQAVAMKAVEAFRQHGTIARAAAAAKIDRRTLKDWLHKDPLLAAMFKDADEDVTDDLEESAIQQAKDGNGSVLIHLLASRRERYKHRKELEVVQAIDLESVTDKLRQVAIAQPTLAPTIRAALMRALEKLP